MHLHQGSRDVTKTREHDDAFVLLPCKKVFTLCSCLPSHLSHNRTFGNSQNGECVYWFSCVREGGGGGFLFVYHWSTFHRPFYSNTSINLTLPSGHHLPLSPSVNPGHFIFIPSFLLWLRYGHYLSRHVRLQAWWRSDTDMETFLSIQLKRRKKVKSLAWTSAAPFPCQWSTLTSRPGVL